MTDLDSFDRAILRELSADGRISVMELARRIGLSKSPTQARVKRLEDKLAECEALMADPAVYADAGKVADLGRQQLQLRTELDAAEAELLALYD